MAPVGSNRGSTRRNFFTLHMQHWRTTNHHRLCLVGVSSRHMALNQLNQQINVLLESPMWSHGVSRAWYWERHWQIFRRGRGIFKNNIQIIINAKVEGSLGGVAKSTLELCQLTIVEVHFSFLTLYLPKDTLYIYIFDVHVHLKIVLWSLVLCPCLWLPGEIINMVFALI